MSPFVDTTTRPALPDAVTRRVTGAAPLPHLRAQERREAEVRRRKDAAEARRRLSAL